MANFAVIICAAGESRRFGGKKKKAFTEVGGRAAFLYSLEIFTERSDVKQVLLAIPPEDEEMVRVNWGPNLKFFGVEVCFGGKERVDTVQQALALVRSDIDFVAVHDAARCCVTKKWVDECFEAAKESGAAIAAAPVVGTVKKVADGAIIETVDRAGLWEAQTPQVFSADLLRKAYANIDKVDRSRISDDSQLVEKLGVKVKVVEADASNIKITYRNDAVVAESIIKSRPKAKLTGPVGPYVEAEW